MTHVASHVNNMARIPHKRVIEQWNLVVEITRHEISQHTKDVVHLQISGTDAHKLTRRLWLGIRVHCVYVDWVQRFNHTHASRHPLVRAKYVRRVLPRV